MEGMKNQYIIWKDSDEEGAIQAQEKHNEGSSKMCQ